MPAVLLVVLVAGVVLGATGWLVSAAIARRSTLDRLRESL
jgi:hypothetical protein